MNVTAERMNIDTHLDSLVAAAHAEGLAEGLAVAERIAGWLTEQPQSAKMSRIEAWARKTITEARQGAGLDKV